jgi:hypothetical protein
LIRVDLSLPRSARSINHSAVSSTPIASAAAHSLAMTTPIAGRPLIQIAISQKSTIDSQHTVVKAAGMQTLLCVP